MRRYLGRIAGASLGAMAGIPGLVFGLLSGWLVDQYRAETPSRQRMLEFIRYPERERRRRTAQTYTTVVLLASALTAEGMPDEIRLVRAADTFRPGKTGHKRAEWNARNRLLREAVELRAEIDPERVARAARDHFGESGDGWSGVDTLLTMMVDAVLPPEQAVTSGTGEVLQRIGTALNAGPQARRYLRERLATLDTRSCLVLGIDPRATREDVRLAYRRLATNLHPDTAGELDPTQQGELREAFLRVRQAYDTVTAQLDARRDERFTPKQ